MPDQTDWTEERVRRLLIRARPYAEGGSILGARLGGLLRRLDPDFRVAVLGDQKLKSLLGRFPDLATIEDYEKSLDFVFRFRDSEHSPGAQSQSTKVPPRQSLDPDLWTALVAAHSRDTKYLDLHTLEIVAAPSNSALDASDQTLPILQEPERFLVIPPIPQEELREVARRFVEDNTEPTARKDLLASLEQEAWFPTFTRTTTSLGLRQRWLSAHREYVLTAARKWLKDHEIDERRFIRNTSPRQAAEKKERSSVEARAQQPIDFQREHIRQLVIRAVGRMSDEELLNLPIPLRYLIP